MKGKEREGKARKGKERQGRKEREGTSANEYSSLVVKHFLTRSTEGSINENSVSPLFKELLSVELALVVVLSEVVVQLARPVTQDTTGTG